MRARKQSLPSGKARGGRSPFSARLKTALLAKLRRAAEQSGRSDSQEAEYRLDASFRGAAVLGDLLGGEAGVWGLLLSSLSPAVRRQLRAGAKESGRSIAAEIEHHVRRSAEGIEAHAYIFGGRDKLAALHWLSLSWALIEGKTGRRITEDDETFQQARELLLFCFDRWFQPGRGIGIDYDPKAPRMSDVLGHLEGSRRRKG